MVDNKFRLMTALEAEDELGKKYFYRQKTYRYHEAGRLHAFAFRGRQAFLPHKLLQPYLEDLKQKLLKQFPELQYSEAFYDDATRRVIVDGIFGRYVAVNADKENEEDLLRKIANLKEWFMEVGESLESEDFLDSDSETFVDNPVTESAAVDKRAEKSMQEGGNKLSADFPEGITYVRVDTPVIDDVEVKSLILISLPSIAKFIGVKSDQFSEWVSGTTFKEYILSAHPKQINDPGFSGPWKKGTQQGLTGLLSLEIIPELLVAFRQSNRTPAFPARAEQLYMLAKSTLEAVGLSISGDQTKAARELAKISEGLGISAADQVIEIFKRYESRPFQIDTNKKFRGKVMNEGGDIKKITGTITLGVTGRWPNEWIALGAIRHLPAKERTSGREVMRSVSPADSVGVTFSESHFIKDSSNMGEVIKTGRQGKDFYTRLKEVGLLDD